jgi:hypothetical protein
MNRLLLLPMLVGALASDAAEAAKSPGDKFDLTHWKLTLPVDAAGTTSGKATEVSAAQLASGYTNAQYFQTGVDGTMVFWCPVNGATTEGSDFPRSELREMLDPANSDVNWTAHGTHILEAQCRVTEVPSSQKVIIGQIHGFSGAARPLIKLQFFKGRIEAQVKLSPNNGTDRKLVFPEVGLNNDINYQIKLQDGRLDVTVNGETRTENIFGNDADWANQTFYFKAGAYCQDNEGPANEGARVCFSRLKVSHAPSLKSPDNAAR